MSLESSPSNPVHFTQPPRLLRTEEVAEWLSVSPRTVHNLRANGVLRSVMVGGRRRFQVADVQEFIDRNTSFESPLQGYESSVLEARRRRPLDGSRTSRGIRERRLSDRRKWAETVDRIVAEVLDSQDSGQRAPRASRDGPANTSANE